MVRQFELEDAGAGGAAFHTLHRPHPAQIAVAWVVGGLATIGAVILGSVLAVVFAATLAVILVAAAALLTFTAVAWRLRRARPHRSAAEEGVVLNARKVGHSWVAYGWDQQP